MKERMIRRNLELTKTRLLTKLMMETELHLVEKKLKIVIKEEKDWIMSLTIQNLNQGRQKKIVDQRPWSRGTFCLTHLAMGHFTKLQGKIANSKRVPNSNSLILRSELSLGTVVL